MFSHTITRSRNRGATYPLAWTGARQRARDAATREAGAPERLLWGEDGASGRLLEVCGGRRHGQDAGGDLSEETSKRAQARVLEFEGP